MRIRAVTGWHFCRATLLVLAGFWAMRLLGFERLTALSSLIWLVATTVLPYSQITWQNNQVLLFSVLSMALILYARSAVDLYFCLPEVRRHPECGEMLQRFRDDNRLAFFLLALRTAYWATAKNLLWGVCWWQWPSSGRCPGAPGWP